MRPRAPLLPALAATLLVGSCVTGESPTQVERSALASLSIQPALIPTPADGSALPINRIRLVALSVPGDLTLADSTLVVSPTSAEWDVTLRVPVSATSTQATLQVYLVNEASGGARTVQFSGVVGPLTLTRGQVTTPTDIPLVRGPLANLFVTGLVITTETPTIVQGRTTLLDASVEVSGTTATPTVYWTSLDPSVVTTDSATALGVQPGTAQVVASAGIFADTTTVTVVAPTVDSVRVAPDSAAVQVGQTSAYTATVLDADGNQLLGRVVRWTTGDEGVATVDSMTGVVTGVAVGVTTVTATSEGVSDDAIVAVVQQQGGGGQVNTWITTGGVWSNPANWSLGRVPQTGDTVHLTQGVDYQVTLDVSPTIARLVIGGTADVITLDVGDQALTIANSGAATGLEIRPLGSVSMANGEVIVGTTSNAGTIRVTGISLIQTSLLTNSGQLRVATGGVLQLTHPAGALLDTSGTLAIEQGASLSILDGDLFYRGGTIESGGGLGLLQISTGGTLSLGTDLTLDETYLILEGASVVSSGGERLMVPAGSAMLLESSTGQSETNVIVELEGSLLAQGPASFLNDSLYVRSGGLVQVAGSGNGARLGTWGVDNDGAIVLVGDAPVTFGPGATTGQRITTRLDGALYTASTAANVIDGELLNEGLLGVQGPTELRRMSVQGAHVAAQHVSTGTVQLLANMTVVLGGSAPSFTNAGVIQAAGNTTFAVANLTDGSFTNTPSGVLTGAGTIDVTTGAPTALNQGTIEPGFSPGAMTWAGDLGSAATARLDMEVQGVLPGSQYDQLVVTGAFALGGTLDVTFPGFTPIAGQRFALLTFASRTGAFDAVTIQSFVGLALDTVWSEAGTRDTLFIEVSDFPLAFSSDRAGDPDIWLQSANGLSTLRLTSSADTEFGPSWSPDFGQIAYTRVEQSVQRIWLMNADGTNQARVTDGVAVEEGDADWSPLGNRFAYARNDGLSYDVWVMNKDGTGASAITVDRQWNERRPDWLFNGLNIAYVSDAGGDDNIWVTDSIGSSQTQVTFEGTSQIDPRWSPDGTQLAFASDEDGDMEIWVVAVDNSDPGFPQFGQQTQITFNTASDTEPSWSPDGKRIYYTSTVSGNYEIWSMDPDGGNPLQVTNHAATDQTPSVNR